MDVSVERVYERSDLTVVGTGSEVSGPGERGARNRPGAGRRGAARAHRRPRPAGDGRGADRHHPGQQHRSRVQTTAERHAMEDCTRFTTGSNPGGYTLTGVDVVSVASLRPAVYGDGVRDRPQRVSHIALYGFNGSGQLCGGNADRYPPGGYHARARTRPMRWWLPRITAMYGCEPRARIARIWGTTRVEYSQTIIDYYPLLRMWTNDGKGVRSLLIAIKGTAVGRDDATLSGLSVSGQQGANPLVTFDLSPAFDPGIETYSVSVSANYTQVTFMPATNHDDATVAGFRRGRHGAGGRQRKHGGPSGVHCGWPEHRQGEGDGAGRDDGEDLHRDRDPRSTPRSPRPRCRRAGRPSRSSGEAPSRPAQGRCRPRRSRPSRSRADGVERQITGIVHGAHR